MFRRNPKSILICRDIVHIHRKYIRRAGRLHQCRHIPSCYGITRFGTLVLSRKTQVGNCQSYSLVGIPQGTGEKQQPTELITDCLVGFSVERLNYKHVPVSHTAQWPYLEFTVLEVPLLVRHQLRPNRCRCRFAKTSAAMQRKNRRPRFRHDQTPENSGSHKRSAAVVSGGSKRNTLQPGYTPFSSVAGDKTHGESPSGRSIGQAENHREHGTEGEKGVTATSVPHGHPVAVN